MSEYNKVTLEIISKLRKITGDDSVFSDEETLKLNSEDETEDLSFTPEVVVKPANTLQVSEILKLSNEHLILFRTSQNCT